MAKRANGEGTIYKRQDGRWTARISLADGKRKDFFGKTRQEVAAKLATALKSRQDGLPLVGERQSVSQFLTGWLEGIKPTVRPSTHSTYKILRRLHVIPYIGKHRLARLLPQHLQQLYSERLDAGLSPQSVRKIHAVIQRALEQAARWNLVVRNPAHFATPPRDQHHEITPLNPEQARRFLEDAAFDRLGALYVLAVTTGMRQGELLALRRKDEYRGRLAPGPGDTDTNSVRT
jgi:integrase